MVCVGVFEEELYKCFWCIDCNGLVIDNMEDFFDF